MLNHNITLDEIQKIKTAGFEVGFEKKLSKSKLIDELTIFSSVYRLKEKKLKLKGQRGIRDILQNSIDPVIIYASGYSSLFRTIDTEYSQCQSSLRD